MQYLLAVQWYNNLHNDNDNDNKNNNSNDDKQY